MGTPKGKEKTGGRKKGTPNKTTAAVKQALLTAFDELGGVPFLVSWGKENPTEFLKLWVKVLPVEVKNADDQPFQMHIVEEIVSADDPGT